MDIGFGSLLRSSQFRGLASLFLVATFAAALAPAAYGAGSTTLVISQVYGGAGCATAGCSTYKNDYIELFNRGTVAQSLNGWSVQYASAAGTGSWTVTSLPNVTLQPGQYYLIAESAGANGVSSIPTADTTGTIAMAATAGKVALLNSTTALSGACPSSASIIDLVGYGTTANCNEGGANAPAPSTGTADVRASGGCTDTNTNSTDFVASNTAPRNTSTTRIGCASPNNAPTITAPANPIVTTTQDAAPFTVSLSGSDDGGIYVWSATAGTGIATVTVSAGQSTATPTFTVTLSPGFFGTASFTATLTDNVSAANQAVNILVTQTPPPAPTGLVATAGNGHVALTWNTSATATTYTVKRGITSGSETPLATVGTSSYDDTSAANGTQYFYVVTASNSTTSGNSNEVSATPLAPPATPTGVTASATSGNVSLTWTGAGPSYNVMRATMSGGPYALLNSSATNSYNDATVANGTTYYYEVVAVGPGGQSTPSSEVSATPIAAPAPPTNLTAAAGNAHVQLSWTGSAGATSYSVKRSAAATGPFTPIGSPTTATTFDDTSAVNGTTYHYIITASNAGGESPNSPAAAATPDAAPIAPASLTATAGANQITLTWTAVSNATSYNILRSTVSGAEAPLATSATSSYVDTAVTNGTQYFYVVRALGVGGTGPNSPEGSAIPQAVPAAPAGVTATSGNAHVALSWSAPSSATSYNVKRATVSGGPYTTIASPITTSYDDLSAVNGTPYFYVVSALNGSGEGFDSAEVSATPQLPPAAPTGVTATAANTHVLLSWAAATNATSYSVQRATASGGPYTVVGSVAATSYDDSTVTNGTTYFYVVSSTGAGGASGNSTEVSATPQAPPATPTGVAATTGNAQVALSWSASTGAITYNVKRATVSGGPYTTIASPATNSDNDTTAANGTRYFYVISAVSSFGESANSAEVSATPLAPPAVPTGVTASAGNNHIALSWTPAAGASSYNVKRTTVAGGPYTAIASSTGSTYDDLSAANGTTYFYVISGVNAVSESANSTEVSATPQAPPGAPIGVVATAGNAQVALSWTAVTGATTYNVKRATTTGGPYTTTASPANNNYTDTTAANGTQYFYVVSAQSPSGESANSSQVSATPLAPPATPTGVTANASNNHVVLSWTAASSAASYNVKRATVSGGPYAPIASPTTNSYDDLTAANGTTYFYVVSGVNALSESGNSSQVSATPNLTAPIGLTATGGNASVALSWTAVPNATGYSVKRSTTSGGPYTPVATALATTTYTDSTVTNGTSYFYVVTATSPGVESPASAQVSATPAAAVTPGAIVISQVYGGGGNSGATYKSDFIELFNRGGSPVSVTGWSVQYASAALANGTAWSTTALTGTINPGQYFLVQESAGTGGTVNLPTPDVTGTIAVGSTAGRIALVASTTALTTCPAVGTIVDLVGYGPTATCSETSPTAVLSNTTAALRNSNGCADTNNNNSDFTVGSPAPRNSATATNLCGAGAPNNPPVITAPANPIATVTQGTGPFTVSLTGSDDNGVYGWSAAPGTGVASVTVTGGQTTANVTYTVTLTAGFTGTATFTATLSDNLNGPVNQAVNILVNASGGVNNPPLINAPASPITTVTRDSAPFTVNLSGTDDGGVYNWTATPGTGIASVNVTAGQGTSTATFTVTLNAGFTGTATFTAFLSDNVNPLVSQAVNIQVTVPPPPSSHVVISQMYGGGGNTGATYQNDFVELFNPTAGAVSLTGWTLQYGSATSTSTFANIAPIGGSIGPGEYYLVGLASGGAVGAVLPTPNASGSINMSGTAGKIALVSSGTALAGNPCSATLGDATLVDFVGYGTTANCSEGNAPAAAPSNTTSLFRKNGGNTDTNNNLNDFTLGTSAPRRTAPIAEIGPSVVTTDPLNGTTTAPRDASMIVTFSEPVHTDASWFNILCVTTGLHNDATVAAGAPNSWVIIPNVNFVAGESCTATIYKDRIHDDDLDDSAPNTDTLFADYTWTFTVSTGTAPPYTSDVHLTMGNPSGAVADINVPNNYLMVKPEYAESYNRDKGSPNWVSWHLSDEWITGLARVDSFRPDPMVPPAWYRVLASDFFASGFDRGHMTPNADRNKSGALPINQATFLMSNMVAQAPGNNQGPWGNLESYLRTLLPANEIYIVSGPAGVGGTGSNGGVTTAVANGRVTVPAYTWKVALILPKATGDDVARVTPATTTLGVIMPNIDSIRADDWHIYLTTVDAVETLTGYDFFPNVAPAIQGSIEAATYGDPTNPPGTGGQSTSTREDVAKTITLDAVSPSGAALTYTIVTGPAHGSLAGSGANQTYTPVPDYDGSDSFTFRVSDGIKTSNTSTVGITVLEVNDPPVAMDDAKAAVENAGATFPASDLTLNDSAGPANESTQTLTVTSVTATATTHGSVVLSGGQITYSPQPGYTDASSFGYQVCDNGVTVGLADPLCATATVNLNVGPATATHFSIAAPANATAGTPFNITVTALDASNAVVASYSGTVHFSSSATATLPPDTTFVSGDGGVRTFSILLRSAGTQTITATDTTTAISGSASISFAAALRPTATIPSRIEACAESHVVIPVTLTGAAPWTLVWSDGVTQTGITSPSASRDIYVSDSLTLSITSVRDANGGTGSSDPVEIVVNTLITIARQPENQAVTSGTPATFTVVATGSNLHYQWFYDDRRTSPQLVGGDSPTYRTPPITQTSHYYVRVLNSCAMVDSRFVVAAPGARGRAVKH